MNGKEEGSTSAPESPGSRSRENGSAARILPHNNGKNKNNYVQNKDFYKF